MGMSASQARFLSLTARKTNVEYEGQQINQQRTALSNESSNYYSQLTSMTVPTPPASSDFTKVTYTFKNGTEKNTVTSLIATTETKNTGIYKVNYVQEIPQDSMVVQGTTVISKVNDTYRVGSVTLQPSKTNPAEEFDASTGRIHLKDAGVPESILSNMSDAEVTKKLQTEAQYYVLANNKYYGGEGHNWLVRYHVGASGTYEPILYDETELSKANYNETTTMSLGGIKAYVYGSDVEVQERKNVSARVEQDSSGRYIGMIIYPSEEDANDNKNGTYYELTTTTESDEAGYNDAMNQYYYKKAQYDEKIQEVNSKIEIIQVQDKNLELKLKQLDTEENALSTEMDAVKKVISKNVESSFKTFNA